MSGLSLSQLLEQQWLDASPPSLLVADENTVVDQLPGKMLSADQPILTNRYDIGHALQHRGARPQCNDLQFEDWPADSLGSVIYRVSKEKAVVHHIINHCGRLLAPGGRLILIGHKREGIASYGRRGTNYLGGQMTTVRGDGGMTAFALQRGATLGAPLPDDEYSRLRPCIDWNGLTLFSKPGIYGWRKVDRGSLQLMAAFEAIAPSLRGRETPQLLDLGCGYGLLGILATRLAPFELVATDNNYAAALACERNFREHGINGRVIIDNCAAQIKQSFDIVLCNPPFHQGFVTDRDLTARFVKAAAHRLKPQGSALFVVNQFVGIERYAQACFRQIKQLQHQQGFKVLLMQEPHLQRTP